MFFWFIVFLKIYVWALDYSVSSSCSTNMGGDRYHIELDRIEEEFKNDAIEPDRYHINTILSLIELKRNSRMTPLSCIFARMVAFCHLWKV